MVPSILRNFVVLYFLPRVLRRDPAAGCSPSPWVPITSPLSRRGPRVASLPAIRSERSTLCALWRAERREAREKGFDYDRRTIQD